MLDPKYNKLLLKLINAYSSIALSICYISDELEVLKDEKSSIIKDANNVLKDSRKLHQKLEQLVKDYN